MMTRDERVNEIIRIHRLLEKRFESRRWRSYPLDDSFYRWVDSKKRTSLWVSVSADLDTFIAINAEELAIEYRGLRGGKIHNLLFEIDDLKFFDMNNIELTNSQVQNTDQKVEDWIYAE